MRRLSRAESILLDLGVEEPRDIDLEAIAWHQGAKVKYRRLDGCEARIVGIGDRAVITVDDTRGRRPRIRFSLAHELGHWNHHRGRAFVCRPEDIGNRTRDNLHPERVADAFAADLLLPDFMFVPLAGRLQRVSLDEAQKLAEIFEVSLTATAIRLVEKGPEPAVLVCHGREGRKWFTRSPGVPGHWFPKEDLDPDSFAFDVVFGEVPRSRLGIMGADAWFDRHDADRFEVLEQSVRITEGEALSLIIIKDEKMLMDVGTQRRFSRR